MFLLLEKGKYCVILFGTSIIILYNLLSASYVFAQSPSFSLQGIDNSRHHWQLEKGLFFGQSAKNITQCSTMGGRFPFPQIVAVNYISSGKVLNATLWLASPSQEPTASPTIFRGESSSLPTSVADRHDDLLHFTINKHIIRENVRKYAFIIHVDSTYDIGQTYQVAVDWNNTSHIWRRTTTQSVPFSLQADNRVLQQKNNDNLSFVPGENNIDLSLNLGLLSYPSDYSIVAYELESYQEDSVFCKLVDVSDVVHIPPPEFSMSALPSSISLLAGQNKPVELQLKSNTNLYSNISLSADQNPRIKLTFEPNKLYIPPFGISSSLIHVNALDNATANPYTFPIEANISFPLSIRNWLTGDMLANPGTEAIAREANFTVLVVPPPTLSEQLNNVWSAWGTPISGIVGLIGVILGGIGGWLLKHFKSKKSEEGIQDKYKKMREDW